MRQPTRAERLMPFAVFAGRDLQAGRPLIARLVGRKLDALLEAGHYEQPFDARFGKSMLKTLSHLCAVLGCTFGYAERTELSLFAVSAGGDARRLLSRIGGEASAKLSLLIGQVATFDAHLYELPDLEMAREYFRWRQEEALLHGVDRYCHHVLSAQGADPSAVPRILDGLGPEEKVELLRQNALEWTQVPTWQRRGAAVRLRPDGAPGMARLLVDLNLPEDEEFGTYVATALAP
jgi:tRNA(His) guanylyltransferase